MIRDMIRGTGGVTIALLRAAVFFGKILSDK
jgi:hypothetical protein